MAAFDLSRSLRDFGAIGPEVDHREHIPSLARRVERLYGCSGPGLRLLSGSRGLGEKPSGVGKRHAAFRRADRRNGLTMPSAQHLAIWAIQEHRQYGLCSTGLRSGLERAFAMLGCTPPQTAL